MKPIDALGLACPQPVILTKRAIRDENPEELLVLVDNEIATENLAKMAKELAYSVTTAHPEEGRYEILLTKIKEKRETKNASETKEDYVVVLAHNLMGGGDETLSKTLMKSFLYALTEQDDLPKAVLCYNAGVFLTSEESDALEDLKTLQEKGVSILSCGLCLDYYHRKENLLVGEVTNMYRIVELMRTHHVVKPW